MDGAVTDRARVGAATGDTADTTRSSGHLIDCTHMWRCLCLHRLVPNIMVHLATFHFAADDVNIDGNVFR